MAIAWDGFDSDTREALRGTNADANESFYARSSSRRLLGVFVVALSLIVVITGFAIERPIGYAVVLLGVFGLVVAAIWLSYRS